MSQAFWQAKIWGLLHDPVLKSLHTNTGRGGNSFWRDLAVMKNWVDNNWDPETRSGMALKQIHLADYITSASDRGAIGALSKAVNYGSDGLEVAHLLSGAKLPLKLSAAVHSQLLQSKRAEFLNHLESQLLPSAIRNEAEDIRKVFWWLWRCLPAQACTAFEGDESLLLMPAETRLPDSSLWNHASLTAALAGSLAGYDLAFEEIEQWPRGQEPSHPYLATFSFTPIQELIKASRKMRDFWAGSWILHYLSAKVCWTLACKYGPDSLIYPSLFQQPLIDHWLLQKWPEFGEWISQPSDRQLLTAGFPNVIVMVLPKGKVQAAMQLAEETLKREWLQISHLSFEELFQNRYWMRNLSGLANLQEDHKTWKGWLSHQWQTYWSAVAIGREGEALKSAAISKQRESEFQAWVEAQNKVYDVVGEHKLFQEEELEFLRQAYEYRLEKQGRRFSVNIGSWWPYIFSKARATLAGSKNARAWELPTVFSVRSTVSGLGPAVHPGNDWIAEGVVKQIWKRHAGLFDGSEHLNATETVKRVLHKVLPELLGSDEITATYPDLTAGVAGYLKVHGPQALSHFHRACMAVKEKLATLGLDNVLRSVEEGWGIPWIDEQDSESSKKYHSRFLNLGWLLEDSDDAEVLKDDSRKIVQSILDRYYPVNNPSDWYVLAAGDGDGLSEWLKGSSLGPYFDYIPQELTEYCEAPPEGAKPEDEKLREKFKHFLGQQKRMGPSTHGALSRALLDFSNQLVPYLTEQRYAGRLIYGGGDDVLAYTNLWEWDQWLWEIRQCFKGEEDPQDEFDHTGNYWQWRLDQSDLPDISARPLFTMGSKATISFGLVIAHHSVPLAIALENLWLAEAEAKKHQLPNGYEKDAVQARVLYGNGNTLKATAKFEVFKQWRLLLALQDEYPEINLEPALFEQAAQMWQQHPVPCQAAIEAWTQAFCDRRDVFNDTEVGQRVKQRFKQDLTQFLDCLWVNTQEQTLDHEVQNWLKLAAFVLRKRHIKQGGLT